MITVFFSWQSDISTHRNLIEKALDRAARSVGGVKVDTATRDTVGAVKIDDKILEKITHADLIIADLSIVGSLGDNSRKSPNPNVIYETGFALGIKGEDKLYLLAQAQESGSNDFPFDLRNRRLAFYDFLNDKIIDDLTKDFSSWISSHTPTSTHFYLDIYAGVNTISSDGRMIFSFVNDEGDTYYIETMHIDGHDIPIERQLKGRDNATLSFHIQPYPFEHEVSDFSFIVSRRGKYYKIYQKAHSESRADLKYNLSSISQKVDRVELIDIAK